MPKRQKAQQQYSSESQSGPPRRPGLLQVLLAKEVRAERSLLLQCIRKMVSTLDSAAETQHQEQQLPEPLLKASSGHTGS